MPFPSKFTPERVEAILKSVSERIPYRFAALANGLSEKGLYAWIKEGKHHIENDIQSPKADFVIKLNQLEQERIQGHMESLAKGKKNWQSQAWILERRWWKDFTTHGHLRDLNKLLEEMESMKLPDGSEDVQNYHLFGEEYHGQIDYEEKEQDSKE
jgi:hypothetical protein